MMFFLLDSLPFNLILVHVSKKQGCPGYWLALASGGRRSGEPLIRCTDLQGWHSALRFMLGVAIRKEFWASECSLA